MTAPENKRKGRPRGKPFEPGNTAGAATQWKEGGPSPNPGGRPSVVPGFRERCREVAARLLEDIAIGKDENGSITRAFEAVADRGGFLPADRQMAYLLKALESPALNDEDRRRVIAEFVGDPPPKALPPKEE